LCFCGCSCFLPVYPVGRGLAPAENANLFKCAAGASPRPTGMTQLYALSALYSSLKVAICPDSIV